ncbi:hypothetical protein AJ79_07248 [Helicocarpus griseus UAMH5409]|uniref:Up-regulated during septation protein 1 domain-containing protein n=1 Tax=Helicocarpus griseus UAMH5409 TaxID=1447875 RepID=A0A2B7X4V4_9EURO|nr:hypothetical protein AJ79_07248 [Helicocarpus griseus UAMH5409]
MMIAVEQKVQDFAVHVGLNNIIARDTSRTTNEKASCGLNVGISGRQTPTDRPRYQLWPTFKKTMIASGRRTPDLSDLKRNPFKEGGTLNRRRKISVPELGPMTTVQEKHMDSPTIPGKFLVHERSNSAPGASWGRTTFEVSALDPVGEPLSSSKESFGKVLAPSLMEDDGHKSVKRASSLLLPDTIAAYPFTAGVTKTPNDPEPMKEPGLKKPKQETRPAVPPKSPRLALRIPPTHPIANSVNSSSNSSATTLAVPANNTPVNNTSTESFIFPLQTNNPESQPAPPDTEAHFIPWISSKGRSSPSHSRNRSAGVCPTYQSTIKSTQNSQRRASMQLNKTPDIPQDSIINRGRPPRKRTQTESPQKHRVNESLDDPFLILPAGIPAHTAPNLLSQSEIERLKAQAWEQAKRFEVLKYSEVRSLSRELRALDQRCEYLRETHKSLRSGRRSLHTRMISYLKSPRVSRFSREGILKQEEALSELDQSIDEWVSKLEHAENRRTRIRQKLLEHMAAALMLQSPPSKSDVFADDQTPPRSPVKIDTPPSASRRDVESIKIYAGAELHTLFANIEKEMERMVNPDASTSPVTEDAFDGPNPLQQSYNNNDSPK